MKIDPYAPPGADSCDPARRIVPMLARGVVAAFLLAPVLMIVAPIALGSYANWAAEKKAKTFCDAIEPDTDISTVITKFEADAGFHSKTTGKTSALHYGFPQDGPSESGHTFLFRGFVFDKAYCDVSLTKTGKVVSTNSYFLSD